MNIALLHSVLSPQMVLTDSQTLSGFSVDGVAPKAAVFPTSLSQAAETLKLANAEKWSIIPWGGGTKMGLGNKPKRVDVVLNTSRLDKIIDIDVANLTVTAQAGVRLGDLQDLLGGSENRCFFPVESGLNAQAEYMCSSRDYKGVFLPLDPPYSDRATLGGVIASNSTGPKRLRYGTPRDLVLGVRYVAPTGEVIGMGGKTVKNVSGYDVSKIMIGSLGTLGILGDITCRLLPLPEAAAAVLGSFKTLGPAKAFADRVLNSKLLPTSLEILNGPGYDLAATKDLSIPPGGWCVAVGVEGFAEEVQREVTDLKEMAHNATASDLAELDRNKAAVFWRNLADGMLVASDRGKAVVKFKGSFLISRYVEMLEAWAAASSGSRFALTASPGLGLAYAYFVGDTDADMTDLPELGAKMRAATELHGGSMVVECAPTALKEKLNPWGTPREDFVLMSSIKNSVDPLGILNPGRFLGGL
jgi:glycolate oxidase FAD binding subunit